MTATVTSIIDRKAQIANTIHQACTAITGDYEDMLENMESVKKLSKKITTTRLDVCLNMANTSQAEQWDETELDIAIGQAKLLAMGNRGPKDPTTKTLQVLCSEIGLCALPKVRAKFPTILKACQEAWAIEQMMIETAKQNKEDAPNTPVRKYQNREYKLVITMTRAVKAGDVEITCAADVVKWATLNDPDFNEDRVSKRINAIFQDLEKVYEDFGLEDIQLAVGYLKTITPKVLMASRMAMQAGQPAPIRVDRNTLAKLTKPRAVSPVKPAEAKNIPPATQPQAAAPTPVSEPILGISGDDTTEEGEGLITGVYDPLNEALNDILNEREDKKESFISMAA